jgi:CHASE3 domain sensor protein
MDSRKKSLLVVVVALVAGIIIGGATAATVIRHNLSIILARAPQEARDDFMRLLSERLDLNSNQRQHVETKLGEMHAKVQLLHQETRSRLHDLFDRFAKDISPDLNQSQQDRLNQLVKELLSQELPPPPLIHGNGMKTSP